MEIVGSAITPILAPIVQYVDQSHGAPLSGAAAHPRNAPIILATSTAIMPPPANPATAVTHPTPKYAQTEFSGRAPAISSTRRVVELQERYRASGEVRNPPALGRMAKERRGP